MFSYTKMKIMKKSILFGFLFTIMVATSCSDNKISEDKVPPAVVSAFKTKYPAATDTKWITEKSDGKTIYEAQFKNEGKDIEAEFNEDGSFKQED
jgi:uncharacterized membrane protein YkoI